MRPLEIALWLVCSFWTAGTLAATRPRVVDLVLTAAAVAFTVLHATNEGLRTQMVPIYVLEAVLAGTAVLRLRSRAVAGPRRGWIRLAVAVPMTAWIAIGLVLPTMFPVFQYDTPRGPHGIGTAVYTLEHAPKGRTLVVQAWYPADASASGPRAHVTTHPAALEDAYAALTGLPRLLFDNLRLITTHAVAGARVATNKRLPVVLFSHGPLAANRSQSVFQMEALASAGFVVIAIDHAGYASTTIFPDGRAVSAGPDAVWPVFVDERSTAMLQTWVSDVRFVLDRLEALDAHDPAGLLTGRLDLTRVGYMGASFGGSVVVQALLDEPRIKAGLAEDGKPYFSDATPATLRRPLMYMQSAVPYIYSTDAQLARWNLTRESFRKAEQDHYSRQMQLFGRAVSPIYNVYIRRTNHVTFSDLDLIVRVPAPGLMSIRQAHAIINAYTVAFFDLYLNGVATTLVDGLTPSPFEDVTVASRNVGAL